MKSGFMLIELIVAFMIAAMIGSLLLTALFQASKFQKSIDVVYDSSMRVGIALNQIEKDLMGSFIPVQAQLGDKQDQKKDVSNVKNDKGAEVAKESKDATEPVVAQQKPLEKIFYSVNKGSNLDYVTFITNNPLALFVDNPKTIMNPKVVRVRYALHPDPDTERKDVFVLMRQENSELDMAQYGATKSYELIGGVKDFSVKYVDRIEKNPEKNTQEQAVSTDDQKGAQKSPKKSEKPSEPKQYEYKQSSDWIRETKQENTKNEKGREQAQAPNIIPYGVEITLSLWNKEYTKSQEFVFSYEIPVDQSPRKVAKKGNAKERQPDNKPPVKPQQKMAFKDTHSNTPLQEELLGTLKIALQNLAQALSSSI